MDLRLWLLLQWALLSVASGNLVFNVHHKFNGREPSLRELRAHDVRRHGRSLGAVVFPMDGDACPSETGLYFTKIGLGSPPKDYYVQIDTRSDVLWVNCASCKKCPSKSRLGFDLTLYDPNSSSSAEMIDCDHDFCISTYPNRSQIAACKSGGPCPYNRDENGGKADGYFVKDNLLLHQVSGILEFSTMTEAIVFGCGAKKSEEQGSSDGTFDGSLGLGQANTSIISQLAAAGKTKKMFAHCLDSEQGGGIFTIGEVVEPKINMIPIIPNRKDYSLVLKDIEVGSEVLRIPANTYDAGKSREVIIDSGTTFTYLPDDIYDALIAKVMHGVTGKRFKGLGDSLACVIALKSRGSEHFPTVKFNFEKSLTLTVHPKDYLFQIGDGSMCAGWLPGGMKTKNRKSTIVLGDMALANKLVVYNLEDKTIGWTEYHCSTSTPKVKDRDGAVHAVKAQDISSAACQNCGSTKTSFLLLMLIVMAFNPLY